MLQALEFPMSYSANRPSYSDGDGYIQLFRILVGGGKPKPRSLHSSWMLCKGFGPDRRDVF